MKNSLKTVSRLYFFRHGIAEKLVRIQDDGKRPLTHEGRKKVRKSVRGLDALGIRPDAVLSSPFVRAMQTAELLRRELGVKKDVVVCNGLRPGGQLKEVYDEARKLGRMDDILLVGHEPALSEMVSETLSGVKHLKIRLKKAGVCCVELDHIPPHSKGILLWSMTPKQLGNIR